MDVLFPEEIYFQTLCRIDQKLYQKSEIIQQGMDLTFSQFFSHLFLSIYDSKYPLLEKLGINQGDTEKRGVFFFGAGILPKVEDKNPI